MSVCLSVWLAGWLDGWMAGWMAGWLAGWLAVSVWQHSLQRRVGELQEMLQSGIN